MEKYLKSYVKNQYPNLSFSWFDYTPFSRSPLTLSKEYLPCLSNVLLNHLVFIRNFQVEFTPNLQMRKWSYGEGGSKPLRSQSCLVFKRQYFNTRGLVSDSVNILLCCFFCKISPLRYFPQHIPNS